MGPYLELQDVSVSFNGFRAVDGLSLSIRMGELRCLIGPNGAGKTTALDLVCGKIKPTSGTISLNGIELSKLEEHEIARAGVGRKFQVASVFKELSVRENLDVAFAHSPGVWGNLLRSSRSADSTRLEVLAERVGLRRQLDKPAGFLSHGETQWLEIGMLLAQDADLILMDEPTAGMTAHETRKTADLFNSLKGEHTLLVVEHDMGFVKAIGDTISVMHQGRLLAEGTAADISRHPEVRRAYLGSKGIFDA